MYSTKRCNMKKKLFTIIGNKIMIAAVVACVAATFIISSCTKSSSGSSGNYAAQFVGTWTATSSTCGASGGSTVFSGSGNTISTSGTVGNTGCVKSITETGTATANGFTFPSQTFTDGCGLSYTISAVGTISGGTLTFTETISGAVTATCTVTATK